MATQQQMNDTYNYMDEICRLSLGENADITCAMYNGDFSKTLEQAQNDKHNYILSGIGFRKGSRVLDIGCGWGPVLNAVKEAGGLGIGLTLSTKQGKACRRNGLEVYVKDWKDIDVGTFGRFDGIVCVGAFEHFCSVEQFQAGRQDEIYRAFFRLCSDLLMSGQRLYLQTGMWGSKPPKYQDLSLEAESGSDEYVLAVLEKFYPGSWLPYGEQQILGAAAPFFKVVSLNNGRLDYIETLTQFGRRIRKFSFAKTLKALVLVPRYIRDREFRYKIQSLRNGYNRECFVRGIMDHQRMVLEKL